MMHIVTWRGVLLIPFSLCAGVIIAAALTHEWDGVPECITFAFITALGIMIGSRRGSG